MIKSSEITEDNFTLYAAQNYRNPRVLSVKEFHSDLARFKYVKKLFSRYTTHGELKHRLILNHIISIYNVFDVRAATKMCFFKLPQCAWPALKTFLVYMNYIDDSDDHINRIACDLLVAKKLKEI